MGKFRRLPQTALNEAAALKLRLEGKTYDQIAEAVGYANKSAAYKAVQRAMLLTIQEPADELRALELARLDVLWRASMDVLLRLHVTVSHGRIVRNEDGQPLEDDGPVLNAVDRLLKIQERRAKFQGLDAPIKHEVMSLEAILAEIARLEQVVDPPPDDTDDPDGDPPRSLAPVGGPPTGGRDTGGAEATPPGS